MGSAGQGKMTTHSQKKFDDTDLLEFRNRFNLPLSDQEATSLTFYKPSADSVEMKYLQAQRQALGGYLPKRDTACEIVPVPAIEQYSGFALNAEGKEMSTTMAFVRMLGNLLKDRELGPRIVPIVADEARTFGMANLFKQVGIYSSIGQHYAPEDIGSVLSYREALDGQILEEGISEASALASWTAAATSYSVHGLAMLPFYIYYSMFGFQRVGDAIWAAADQRARGFDVGTLKAYIENVKTEMHEFSVEMQERQVAVQRQGRRELHHTDHHERRDFAGGVVSIENFPSGVRVAAVKIAKATNVQVISLKGAPKGYVDFDKGAAKKFVIDPHGLLKA